MIKISQHLRGYRQDTGFLDNTSPLSVNCCGYQKMVTQDFSISRPEGRLDYQLIYMLEGEGTFLVDGEYRKLNAGNLILYKPGEPQVYSYCHKDMPQIYWIHFTGNEVEQLLEQFQISTGFVGKSRAVNALFDEIILEFTLKKENFAQVVVCCMYKLLAIFQRTKDERLSPSRHSLPIDELVIELNQSYQKPWTIKSMADFCLLSEGCFSHYFKEYMHIPPLQYLTNVRIAKAEDLLINSDLSISNIASKTGYDNPLYFSRVFRRVLGKSPSEYRQASNEANL